MNAFVGTHFTINAISKLHPAFRIGIASILAILALFYAINYFNKRSAFDAAVKEIYSTLDFENLASEITLLSGFLGHTTFIKNQSQAGAAPYITTTALSERPQVILATGAEFTSSVNTMQNLLDNLDVTEVNGNWQKFSEVWNRHIERITDTLRPIYNGVSAGDMAPGSEAGRLCRDVNSIAMSHYSIVRRLPQIEGLMLNSSGENSISGMGHDIRIPNAQIIATIFVDVCGGNLEEIVNPIDRRTDEEKKIAEIASIRDRIRRLEEYNLADKGAALEKAKTDFVRTIAQTMLTMGMHPPDARRYAVENLLDVLDGESVQYVESADIAAHQRLVQAIRDANRDIEAEIQELESKLKSLTSG